MIAMDRRRLMGAAFFLLALAAVVPPQVFATPAAPAKPYGQVVDEVVAFLESDVGNGGIRTNDNDPAGYPVPPYFYHYAISDGNGLWSSLEGYPGYRSVSYPAYTASVAIDAFLAAWRYRGDSDALARAEAFARWVLEHRTPAGDLYGNLPYSTQTEGVMGGGWDGEAIMPDKAAMFGRRLVDLFDATGDSLYWRGALEITATLAATQVDSGGVTEEGRWPFRVRPSDGLVTQDYTSHIVPYVRFLEEMGARTGDTGWTAAAAAAWQWLLANPCNPASPHYMRWEAFYEDQSPEQQTGLPDHYSASETVRELIARRPPGWEQTARDIMDWIADTYLIAGDGTPVGDYEPCTYEWTGWMEPTFAATLQHAVTCLRLDAALAGDPRRDPAWRPRALAMALVTTWGQNSRGVAADGRMFTSVRDIVGFVTNMSWYEQNFNTVKYLLEMMALEPSLAPDGEDHLLAASAPVTGIAYPDPGGTAVRYTVRGGAGRETLKLAAPPVTVLAGGAPLPEIAPGDTAAAAGWSWDPAGALLAVWHVTDPVEIVRGATGVVPAPREVGLRLADLGGGRLRVETAVAGPLAVEIHDLRGRLVRRLGRGTVPPGAHVVAWDGRDASGRRLGGGVYLVTARSGGRRATGRLVLVR